MLDANYQKHLKILGKLCQMWDSASASSTAEQLLAARFFDQVATGEAGSWVNLQLFAPYTGQIQSAILSGALAIKAMAEQLAGYYLVSAEFRGDLTNTPTSPTSAQSVLEALIAEMTADSKTLTTAAATGLVNFFETVWAPSGSFPQSGSPSYADGTYVVVTIV
jgi:hypothetical protein